MKTKDKLAIVIPLFFAVTIPYLFWVGGFNFNERGETAVACSFMTLISAIGSLIMIKTFPD
jgi:hypothetical protein